MGDLHGRQLLALWAILTLALALRAIGLGWGLPPADAETAASGYRSSYALDEDDLLFSLARAERFPLPHNPQRHSWGILHPELTLLVLEASEAAGYLESPWQDAFLSMQPGGFEQVYIVGRLTTAIVDLATVYLCFLLGLRLAGPYAGLWAAALMALAPGPLVQACQIRGDATAAMLATATALAAVSGARPAGVGLLGGLACAAGPSTVWPIGVLCWMVGRSRGRRAGAWVLGGLLLGLLVGMPVLLTEPGQAWAGMADLYTDRAASLYSAPGRLELAAASATSFFRFGLGIPAGLLAVKGVWDWRRASGVERALAAAFGAGFLAALLAAEPFLRFQSALFPLGAVAAACFLVKLGRWQWTVGAAAALVAGITSLGLVESRLAPHPANLALAMLRQAAAPSDRVSRMLPELPPLDPAVYPLGPNPLLGGLRDDPPEWVMTNSIAAIPYPAQNLELLAAAYDRAAVFRSPSTLWTTLGERGAPIDWNYLRPELTLYRRR